MPYKDLASKQQYDRDHYQANKTFYKAKAKKRNERVRQRRRALLAEFPCVSCGNADPGVIQWHHLDPSQKETTIFSTAVSEEKFWNEVLKCVPLCANCHVKVHSDLLCLLPQIK